MNKISIHDLLLRDIDDAVRQIKNCKEAGQALYQATVAIQAALSEMEMSLRILQAKSFFQSSPEAMDKLAKLQDRCERLRQLRNMMELGSWQISINRTMDELWQQLP
jgi:hypothetical protein